MSLAGAAESTKSAPISFADQICESRNVTIQITNYSKAFILTNPRTYTTSGYCYHPPQPTITKNTQETCSFSKIPHAARGSAGLLTYEILQNETNHVGDLAIMFSVPYDYNQNKNMFALGIYEPNIPYDDDLFKRMYEANDGPFTREEGTGTVLKHSGKGVLLKGTMSAFGQSIIKVELWDGRLAALSQN